jgi:ABC-type polysaccharide/polyol phosphate transport system ATPase subunit
LKLCDRALWLNRGELMMDGKAAEVLQVYTDALQNTEPRP